MKRFVLFAVSAVLSVVKIACATRYRQILSGLLLSACLCLIAACQAWFGDAQGIRTDIHVQQGYETLGEIFIDTQQAVAPELPRSLPEERSNYLPTPCGRDHGANRFSASRHDSVKLRGRRGGRQVMHAIHADWRRRDYQLDTRRLDNRATPVIAGQAEGFRFSAEYIPASHLLVLSGTTPCLPFPGQERLARLIEESRETVVDLPWKHPPDRPTDRTGKCLDADQQVVGAYYAFFREIELGEGDGLALLSAMESDWRKQGFAVEKRGTASIPWLLARVDDLRLVALFGTHRKRLWLGGETPCSPTGQWDNQSLVEQMEKVQKSQKK